MILSTETQTGLTITDNEINGELSLNNTAAFDSQDVRTVRVYWEWKDNRDNDLVHTSQATNDTEYSITVTITATQSTA